MGDEGQPLQSADDSVSPDGAPIHPPEDAQAIEPGSAVQPQSASTEVEFVDSWVGQYLSDYYIMRRIGEGGMGIVYLARHQSLDRLAAVKFLAAHMVTDKGYIERFLKEARGAAKLNHPNIVAVYDAGAVGDNIFYFIMEYIEGRDLGTMLRERRIFPVPEAVAYMRQAASALGYAHKKRIIHRDIKPDNFLLTNEGIIKVGDLGLAKWVGDEDGGGMTQSGVVMGTPFYISPEQVRGAKDVDSRSDIYSLGATFFHLVTGRIPFEGSSPAVIMSMHLNSPTPDPSHINSVLDMEVSAIIQKMMAKAPDERFQTMEEVDSALSDYQAGRMRSVRFNPTALAGLPTSQMLPPTEPPRPPDSPPERHFAQPTVVPSEPFVTTKTALILGTSLVIAAMVFGAFMFLSKAYDHRKGKEAMMAGQPLAKADKPALPDKAASAKPVAPEPQHVSQKPEPAGSGSAPTKPSAAPSGFVRTAPAHELKSSASSPQPFAASTIVADFNAVSEEMLNRDFGQWAHQHGAGSAAVIPGIGPDGSPAFRIGYDVSAPDSEWGIWGRLPPITPKEFEALTLRLKSSGSDKTTTHIKLKWTGRDGEQFSGAAVPHLGPDWTTVLLPLQSMQIPHDAVLKGYEIYFRSEPGQPVKGSVVLDDVALLKKLPPEGRKDIARVEFTGTWPAAPAQMASLAPSRMEEPMDDFSRGPHQPDSRDFMGGPPSDFIPVVRITPDGVIRDDLPMPVAEEFRSAEARKRSYFLQNFSLAKSGQLPAGVSCMVYEPSKRKAIPVGAAGFSDAPSRCKAKWEIVSDDEVPGGKYLKLWHQTAQHQWVMGTQLDTASALRGKRFFIALMVRSGQPGSRLMISTQPETGRSTPVPIPDRWMIVVVPAFRMDLQKIMVGVQGTGEIHVAEVRADPVSDFVRRWMSGERGRQEPKGNMPNMSGPPTGGTIRRN